ncbi:QacE family quaternary ammonium compound efflux SMR transporter [Rhodococcus sp. ACPA4]|uniref:DMT family transporter n=1 Tax=Rhodococcus TaxID=1827 RepID=UPI0005DFE17D|nr:MULTISPECIES: SMR family transporter [Rhodococcus]NRI63942.1 QacE family quaternary ammonium compound efflux SMR transporter [Rhodococcus sp. MS16]KJF22139.1 Spermidine export protein MdtJ [Rhodococcus sp. AD45]PBC40540.1 QacE family quaternary ammonium compound efflux SMR transporter [Rhodococcus sp. ACPA4]PSR39817.1 QacE family quaternary ammonium compound efflux SMR transporter [Rhodococcus sp. AD45-ID]ROZ46346.1 QacE family quaternary ammonium compound efflux SMR transporter [Rhodococcu
MTWIFLIAAILSEVSATLALRMASQTGSNKKWFVVVGAGYVASFAFLTLALDAGLALGVAYGIWTACGVALTALACRILFREALTKLMAAGIALIAAGVVLIELGAGH